MKDLFFFLIMIMIVAIIVIVSISIGGIGVAICSGIHKILVFTGVIEQLEGTKFLEILRDWSLDPKDL